MHSFQFTISSLPNNVLLIPEAGAGQYVILDPGGGIVDVPATGYDNASGTGIVFNFTGIDAEGQWTAKAVVEDGVVTVIPDAFSFTMDDIGPGMKLTVIGVNQGDVVIFGPSGDQYVLDENTVTMPQGNGVQFDFNGVVENGLWHANYLPVSAASTAVQYSSDSMAWHAVYNESGDRYMRFSTDGGTTYSPPILIYRKTGGQEQSSGSSSSEEEQSPYAAGYVTQYFRQTATGNDIVDHVISLTVPHIWMFLEIQVNYEVGARRRDGSYKFSYGNWNSLFEPEVYLNGSAQQLNPSTYDIDYDKGVIYPKYDTTPGDNLLCTYNFSWFRIPTLASYVERSIGTINYHGQGATTSYTSSDLPESFHGISADLCVAMCCENLILGYTMWCGKLIFAISSNDLYNGGGDVASQLETIKRNAEDRAYGALDNENARAPQMLKKPTPAYWRAVTMGTGIRPGPHGGISYGKLRGWKPTRMTGMTGPDLGI